MTAPTNILKNIPFYIVLGIINPKSDGSNTIAKHDVTGKPLYVYLFYNLSSWERKDINPFFRHTGTMICHNQLQSRSLGND